MIHKSSEFNAILALAAEYNITLVVAGGYPRDLAFGREPKDLDICVYNTTEKAWYEFLDQLCKYDLVLEEYSEADSVSSTGDDRVSYVIKVKGNIDIILWNDSFESMESVINNFDFNVNQWILGFETDFEGTPYNNIPKPIFKGDFKTYGKLIEIRNDGYSVSNCRKAKFQDHAKEINWSIECPTNNIPTPK